MRARLFAPVVAAAIGAVCGATSSGARSLAAIQESGTIRMCAHPNSLPFASRTANPPGFQMELGNALAKSLGVSLSTDWILISYQVPRTNCDILLDMISAPDYTPDFGIKLSRPYYRSGVALAVPPGSAITSFATLNEHTKVGVQTGSLAAMILDKRHVAISAFGFDDDMLAALGDGEIAAAAVSPVSAGYYNLQHPDHQVVILPPDDGVPDLVWNIAVGMRHPDPALQNAINDALDHLREDGTMQRIYGRYGVGLQTPQ